MFIERQGVLRVSVAVAATAALAVGALALGLLAANRQAQRKARAAQGEHGMTASARLRASGRMRGRGCAIDYGDRSGWPAPVEQMRGRARADATVPRDMQAPAALRPLTPRV